METTKCRGCGAEIIWTVTENGRRMPIDLKPEKRLLLRENKHPPEALGPFDTYISHFATCPKAADFRRHG